MEPESPITDEERAEALVMDALRYRSGEIMTIENAMTRALEIPLEPRLYALLEFLKKTLARPSL